MCVMMTTDYATLTQKSYFSFPKETTFHMNQFQQHVITDMKRLQL